MPGFVSLDPSTGVQLSVATAVPCANGIVGSAAAVAGWDTLLLGVYIQVNATAVTLTIAGMANQAGGAANMLLTGSTTVDFFWEPTVPVVNSFAAFVFTASVASKVIVFTRAYIGPERPGLRINT
ncbi:MAG: hypothetical protein WCB10_17815 [Steroidobacteraceae bacterium]